DQGAMLDLTDLRHLVRSNVRAQAGEWQAALLECEMARLLNAPPGFVARCRADEGRLALCAGDPERAAGALQQAWQCFPTRPEHASLLNQAPERSAARRGGQAAWVKTDTVPPSMPAPAPTEPTAAPKVDDTQPKTAPASNPTEPQAPAAK